MELPEELVARLRARYREPHRHYHTVAHLTAVLATVDELAPWADRPDLVACAAWYHDAVYDPRRTDNEAASAALARTELAAAAMPAADIDRVAGLVVLTAGHEAPPGDGDAAVLCDADLRILAAPAADYDRYAAAVRAEYAHVGEQAWRTGRTAVLASLLALPQLFRTPPANAWEPAARGNLTRELAVLGGPSGGATPHG